MLPDRHHFNAAFKLKNPEEAARCVEEGAFGAMRRRDRLYSSHLATWRAVEKAAVLTNSAHGRKPTPVDPSAQ